MPYFDNEYRPYALDTPQGRQLSGDFAYEEEEKRRKREELMRLEGNFDTFNSMNMDSLRKLKIYGMDEY